MAEYTLEEVRAARERQTVETLARYKYKYYLRVAYGRTWIPTKMSDFLADRIQAFLEAKTGNAYDILVLNTPPQHGKSLTVTSALPSWYLGRYPDNRVIVASYNDDFATGFARANKTKIAEVGGRLFGLALGGLQRADEFEIRGYRGSVLSRGMRSGITGHPAELIVIDDPVKTREEADSESFRAKIWNEWSASIRTRLAAGGKVILIMTPWHEDDLSGKILRTEKNVTHIRLPVEAEDGDPLGRSPGDALCPELGKDNRWLEQFKAACIADPSGRRDWYALFMCSPRVEGGNIIKRDWWKWYNPAEKKPGYFGRTIISVDATFKGKENNDFVSIQVWSKRYAEYYLRYGINRHLTFTQTVEEIVRIRGLFPETAYIVVEDKANGSAIMDVLTKTITGATIYGVNPKGGKVARVHAAQPMIESGYAYLPEDSAFAGAMVDQFSAFPAAPHDDMVDACTQALSFLLYQPGEPAESGDTARRREIAQRGELALCDNETMYSPYDAGAGSFGGGAGGGLYADYVDMGGGLY